MSHFTAHICAHTRIHTHTHTREYNRANAESYLHTGHVTDISGMHFFLEENTFVRNSSTGLEL